MESWGSTPQIRYPMKYKVSSENMKHWEVFLENLLTIMKERGIKPVDLARGVQASPESVSKWVNLHAYPSVYFVLRIADFLDVSLDRLFGRVTPEDAALRTARDDYHRVAHGLDRVLPREPHPNAKEKVAKLKRLRAQKEKERGKEKRGKKTQ